jgi:gliding motility-associated-like protein
MKNPFFISNMSLGRGKSKLFTLLLSFLVFCLLSFSVKAQLVIDNSLTDQELVEQVLLGKGVQIFNITSTGANLAIGKFDGTASNIGLDSGIIMSTGDIFDAPGPNNATNSTTQFFTPGDADLTNIIGSNTYDAAVLEFDFMPVSDTVRFRYVFSSEEYHEYVNSGFNDVFGFLLSGPNPSGGNYVNENIALIPGTATPVSINNVNAGFIPTSGGAANNFPGTSPSNMAYFIANGNGNGTGHPTLNLDGLTVEYDGFTVVLTAWAHVIPCQTYHIKLAIADVNDRQLDSGVFLEANSFGSDEDEAVADFFHSAPVCVGEGVDFVNNGSTGSGVTYIWDFGTGATPDSSYLENPSGIVYDSPGFKTVKQTVILNCGMSVVTSSQVIYIREEPTASFTNTPVSCNNEPIDFTNTGTSGSAWTYSWDFGNGAIPASSNTENPTNISYTTSGEKIIRLTISNGYCFDTYVDTLVIAETPTANFTSTAPECTGLDVDFTNTGSTGGTWTYAWNFGSGATPATSAAENPSGVVYNTAGTKVIELIVTNGSCADTIVQTITIHQTPNVGFSFTNNVCGGTNVDFTNTGSTGSSWTYSWDFGSGALPATSNNENPVGISYSSHGNKTITQTISSGYCANTTTQVLTILEKPIANFASTAPECTGLDVDFTNTGSTGGAWTYAWDFGSGATPATSNAENPSGVVYNTAGTKVVELIVTDGSCADTIIQTITIHQTPDVGFSFTNNVCGGTNVDFTNTGSTGSSWTYSWDFGSGALPATSNNENPVGINYSTHGTKTITQTISSGYCANTTTQVLTILEKPVADFASTAPECTGLDVDFTNTGSTGGAWTFSWNFGSGATPATSTAENPSGIVYNTAGTKLIELIVTDGSCADTIIQTITIHQTPDVSFTSNAPQCANTGVNFTNTGSTGTNWTYSWDFGQDALPVSSSNENPVGILYSSAGNKNIVFTIADQYCNNTVIQSINIHEIPIADAGEDTTICANRSVQIGSSPISGFSYSWFPASTLDNPNIANPIASPVANQTQYILTVTNDSTLCQNFDTILVTMLNPIIANAGIDVEICAYDSVQIGAGFIEGQIYSWIPQQGLSNPFSSNPIASPDSTTKYTVVVTDTAGCDAISDDVIVLVHPLPDAYAGEDDTIMGGTSTQLIGSGGVQYAWMPPYSLDNPNLFNPVASPDSTTTYILTVTDIFGCVNTDTVNIIVYDFEEPFWLPTAFSPNNDGLNDILYVRGGNYETFEFSVFDRYGKLIFLSQSPEIGWDGTHQFSGKDMPSGAYAYKILVKTTDGEHFEGTGIVNLLK